MAPGHFANWQGFHSVPKWTFTNGSSGSQAWAVNLTTGSAAQYAKSRTYLGVATVRDSATLIDDGTTGYTDTGWTSRSSSAAVDGDYRRRTAGTGSHTAAWTFSGLDAGVAYRIAVTWVAASANASNAPYTVLDGSTLLTTVLANQRVSATDFQIGDRWWESLGTFRTATGTLQVRLSDQANGIVIADAVRIFRVYPASGGSALLGGGGAAPAGLSLAMIGLQPTARPAAKMPQEPQDPFRNASFRVEDLSEVCLGLATSRTVGGDDEFTTSGGQGEAVRMKLWTVLTHELGHERSEAART